MDTTEQLLENMAINVKGNIKVEWMGNTINFKGPYPRLDMMDTLESEIKKRLGDDTFIPTLDNDVNVDEYISLAHKLDIKLTPPLTLNRVIDTLVGELVEPLCIQPTFIINHPQIMSPLAKPHRSLPGKTERFELFVNAKEICNAYTELNNPFQQKTFFENAQLQKDQGDDEIPPSDYHFVRALEFGLPPTAGWGMGIDRLCMIFTNQDSIREVILFPTRKNDTNCV